MHVHGAWYIGRQMIMQDLQTCTRVIYPGPTYPLSANLAGKTMHDTSIANRYRGGVSIELTSPMGTTPLATMHKDRMWDDAI